MSDYLERARALVGEQALQRLAATSVALFGVGGVGSWCAEALVRSGVGRLLLVDPDCVEASNCNRQLPATSSTIGVPKVEAMRRRLLDINPQARIEASVARYTAETASLFSLEAFDFVVDAIDSLSDKAHLILHATSLNARNGRPRLLSSMGAARRKDPTLVRISEFWRVKGDPLAALLRKRFRHDGTLPASKFLCAHSLEDPAPPTGTVNASLCTVTATFGMALASVIVNNSPD